MQVVFTANGDCRCTMVIPMKDKVHVLKKEEGKEKQRLSGPDPATSRSIAYPLAAEPISN